jgi:hypothetical protein
VVFYLNNPLSYFPHGGKEDFAPSPVGEGWEGGRLIKHKCKLKVNEARINMLPLL